MGRIVAVAGGDLDSTRELNKYAIKMTGKSEPQVLFIGTASEDAQGYIDRIHIEYEAMNCRVNELNLIKKQYTDSEIDQLFENADIIYVGGGDTVSMLRIWRKYGVDQKLKNIYEKDLAVLTGISAGAICWFDCGHSDSEAFLGKEEWKYTWANGGLNIVHAAFCPHYNEQGREGFDQMLLEKALIGFAFENNTAFVENNGEIFFIKSKEAARAYKMWYEDGLLYKHELELELVK